MNVIKIDGEIANSKIFENIKRKDSKAFLECIRNGDDVNTICRTTGYSYLHILVIEADSLTEQKFVPMVYQISNANGNLNVVDKTQTTPLQLSIIHCLPEIMAALLKCGAATCKEVDEDLIIKYGKYSTSDLLTFYRKLSPGYWDPVEKNNAFKVNVLLKCWCRININRNGKSLIEYAKEIGAIGKIIKQLVENEVSIEFAHATMAGDENMMKNLLHHTIDFSIRDYANQESPFQPFHPLSLKAAAEKYDNQHVLHLLTKTGEIAALANSKNFNNKNASHVCTIL